VPWEDPSDWVIKTYPWTASQASEAMDSGPPLLRLRPEDVGYDMQAAAAAAGAKASPASLQTETEATNDPLVRPAVYFLMQVAFAFSALTLLLEHREVYPDVIVR